MDFESMPRVGARNKKVWEHYSIGTIICSNTTGKIFDNKFHRVQSGWLIKNRFDVFERKIKFAFADIEFAEGIEIFWVVWYNIEK